MRVLATILLACGFAATAVAPAPAATVSVSDSALRVVADPGEVNALTIATVSGLRSVTDAGAPLVAGDGCTVVVAAVRCAAVRADVDLGDGDDTLTVTASLAGDRRRRRRRRQPLRRQLR